MFDIFDKLFRTFQKVIQEWDILCIIGATLFFPWSLIYVGFRVVQEWE